MAKSVAAEVARLEDMVERLKETEAAVYYRIWTLAYPDKTDDRDLGWAEDARDPFDMLNVIARRLGLDEAPPPHNRFGNCWDSPYRCSECGVGEMCDVCHDHHEARGDCSLCPRCPACEVENEQV